MTGLLSGQVWPLFGCVLFSWFFTRESQLRCKQTRPGSHYNTLDKGESQRLKLTTTGPSRSVVNESTKVELQLRGKQARLGVCDRYFHNSFL
jgi:hypothetical protein